jgi:hypothetical protein
MDGLGGLLVGGGLTSTTIAGMNAGKLRAVGNLQAAAALEVSGDTLTVINLTGHKLLSGYPEGRRMWLNVKWYDAGSAVLREDGAYGAIPVTLNGGTVNVETILDLQDPNTKIYEVHGAITREWANQLLSLGYSTNLPVSYDRVSGSVTYTLGDVAGQAPGTYHESFHFVLNNHVPQDNRIPPFGMSFNEAALRNALPVPATQYGDPGPGGIYQHWDDVALNPPTGAAYATIDLLYQPTSWEYIQFLHLANDGSVAFLANEGAKLLDAWLNTAMAAPVVMASASWGSPPPPPADESRVQSLGTWLLSRQGNPVAMTTSFVLGDNIGVEVVVVDQNGAPLADAVVTVDFVLGGTTVVKTVQGSSDALGVARVNWKTKGNVQTGSYEAVVGDVVLSAYPWNPAVGVTSTPFTLQ